MHVTFMGSGTSHGVPRIGCRCPVCRSDDPHNKRLRPSILLNLDGRSVVVDTSSDFRQQMLAYPIERLDAILFTHKHADHILGLDDVRTFCDRQGFIDTYADEPTTQAIRQCFSYVFEAAGRLNGIPKLTMHMVDGPFDLFGRLVVPVPLVHGRERILGYRMGNFAYLTDCSAIPPESFDLLGGLEVLVLDALRFRPHPTHFSVDESLEVAQILKPRQTWLTHISHDLDHGTTNEMLPADVQLAYDGLCVELA